MTGGLQNDDSQAALTAYILISLLEADVNKTVSQTLTTQTLINKSFIVVSIHSSNHSMEVQVSVNFLFSPFLFSLPFLRVPFPSSSCSIHPNPPLLPLSCSFSISSLYLHFLIFHGRFAFFDAAGIRRRAVSILTVSRKTRPSYAVFDALRPLKAGSCDIKEITNFQPLQEEIVAHLMDGSHFVCTYRK
jgi:hypothetical protein